MISTNKPNSPTSPSTTTTTPLTVSTSTYKQEHSPTDINSSTSSNLLLTTTTTASSSTSSSTSCTSSSSMLTSSTAYTLLNALISILANSEKINRKQQQQIDNFINYWKNFDSKSIQRNINELGFKRNEIDEFNKQLIEINSEFKKFSNEDAQKKCLPLLKSFQTELDNINKRIKLNETVYSDIIRLLSNIPDPLPLIELIIYLNNDFNDKIDKYENDNKQLRDALDDYTNEMNLESRQSEKDKELIKQLYEQISKTTSSNLDLTAKLEVAESEIESYKKIISNYQSKISEMKIKCIVDNNDNNNNISTNNVPLNNTTNINNFENDKLKKLNNNRSSNNLLIPDNTTKQINSNKWNSGALLSPSSANQTQLNSNNLQNTNTNRVTRSQDVPSNSTQKHTSNAQNPISQATTLSLKNLLNKEKSTHIDDNNNINNFDSQLSPISSSPMPYHQQQQQQQHHVEENVINYEPLNTSDIAQRVRDLLSVHNIGQRIFAKYILGLSQGTVSELLSKPKHWDKLTEKGRESYRKMYTWSLSDDSINALKAISPRKGNKDNYFYQNGKDDSATEERIVQILNEAQKQMQKSSNHNNSAINGGNNNSLGLHASLSKQQVNDNDRKPQNETEKQHQLIVEQLKKFKHLMGNNAENSGNNNPIGNKSNNHDESEYDDDNEDGNNNNQSNTNDEEYNANKTDDENNTSDNENDENKSDDPLDLTVKPSTNEIIKLNRLKRQHSYDSGLNEQQKQNDDYCFKNKKQATQVAQQMVPNSPLLQMQSIANSYLSNTKSENNNNHLTISSSSSTASSTSPSPIPSSLQQQNLNVLNNIKNNNSPSPVSNTSANSIYLNSGNTSLKPLKSVLPPVSQEQFDKYSFINTEDLVKKVKDLLSKYSISQRLFGEYILGLSQGSVSDLLARPKPWMMLTQKGREPFIRMQMFIDDGDAIKKLMTNQYKIPSDKFIRTAHFAQTTPTPFNNTSQINGGCNNYPQSNDNSNDELILSKNTDMIKTHQNYSTQLNIIPYDISSLTSAITDINTEEITNKVKETLLNNNIGQKLFGEAVLNLSQGTVSELLSKPKPWNTLSIKGREPYLRMYMWLNDSQRLEKLNEWKEEKNSLKRTNTEVENDQQKPKRRFIFTEEQKEKLMKAFRYDPYPSVNQMELLAGMLNLATRTVINWFHNHRMRIRYKTTAAAAAAASGNGNNSSNNSLQRQSPTQAQQLPQQQQHQQQGSKFSLEQYNALSKLKYTNNNTNSYSLNGFKNSNNKYGLNYNSTNNNGSSISGTDDYNDGIMSGNDCDNDDMMDDDMMDGDMGDENYDNCDYNDNENTTSHIYDGNNQDNETEYTGNDDVDENGDNASASGGVNNDDDEFNTTNNQNDDNEDQTEMNSLFIDPNSSEQYNSNDESNDSVDMKNSYNKNNNCINNIYQSPASNLNSTRSNKRRKPDNPQKLSQSNNKVDKLLNNRILKQQEQNLNESDEQQNFNSTTTTTTTNEQINDNIAVH